jgi:chromosome segregation ATPase
MEVAKSDRAVADAQLKRALAERDLLKKQYASADQLAPVEQDINAGQERIKASDLKQQYLQQMIAVAESERKAAEAHVNTTQAQVEQAKLRAMKENNVPQAASANAGDIDRLVADAQSREAGLQQEVAQRRSKAVDLYNRWQQADARSRNLARPSTLPVPPPTTGEPTPH